MFSTFLQHFFNGISQGSIYALIALGYTMVYGIVKLINFAHGDVLMLGAFSGIFVISNMGGQANPLTLIVCLIVSMVLCALIGMLIEVTCYKPLRNAPKINSLITAIGVSIIIENGARFIPFIGTNFKMFPTMPDKNIHVLGATISVTKLIGIGTALLLMAVLYYVVNFTKTGKAMRAVSYDTAAAQMMGISVNRIISFTFAIGAALAAAAGIIYATNFSMGLDSYMGIMPGLKAFVAAVVGGIGSIPGALLGGFIIGIAESLTKGYIDSQLADAIVFGLLIVILLFKPSGLVGKNIKEKV